MSTPNNQMKWWKALGAAAFVGVAATGVVVVRAERQRRAYTPEQVRDRLRDRMARVEAAGEPQSPELPESPESRETAAVPLSWRAQLRACVERPPVARLTRRPRRTRASE